MKQKFIYALPLLGAAICLTACGRNNDDQHDRAVTDVPRTNTIMTDRPNHPNRNGNVVDDVIDDGEDIVSDVIKGGKDIVDDAMNAVDDTDEHDNYRVGTDGRTDSNSSR